MDIIRKLKFAMESCGLTEEEIAFYVQTLKKPGASIFNTAQRAKLPKDRAYNIFYSLEDKGLLTASSKGKLKKISPIPLQNFIERIYSRGNKFYRAADNLKNLQQFLPYLSMPLKDGYIRALDAQNLAEDWVDLSYINWENVLVYGDFEMLVDKMGVSADNEFMRRRLKRGKQAFPLLANPGPYTWDLMTRDYKEMRNTKILKLPEFKNNFVMILPDKHIVALWIKDKNGVLSGIKVESSALTKLHEQTFKYLDSMAVKS